MAHSKQAAVGLVGATPGRSRFGEELVSVLNSDLGEELVWSVLGPEMGVELLGAEATVSLALGRELREEVVCLLLGRARLGGS